MHSVRAVRTNRSAQQFALRACGGVLTMFTPPLRNTSPNAGVNSASRSRTRKRNALIRSPRPTARLRAACATQPPVGRAVTPSRCTRRVRISITNRTYTADAGRSCRYGRSRRPIVRPPACAGRFATRCSPHAAPDRSGGLARSAGRWLHRRDSPAARVRHEPAGIPSRDSPVRDEARSRVLVR